MAHQCPQPYIQHVRLYSQLRGSNMDARPSSYRGRKSKCCDKATEFLCSACLLCVSCPLTVVWCCLKLPCKVGWHAAQHARKSVCGSGKRVYASYSSFSDIDLNTLPGKSHRFTKSSMGAPSQKQMAHMANQLQHRSPSSNQNLFFFFPVVFLYNSVN